MKHEIVCAQCNLKIMADNEYNVNHTFDAHLEVVHNIMTGQEWFDAFLQECPSWSEADTTAKSFEKVYINVAKKVSGVE